MNLFDESIQNNLNSISAEIISWKRFLEIPNTLFSRVKDEEVTA